MSPEGNWLLAFLLALSLLSLLTLLVLKRFRSLRSKTVDKIIEAIHKYRGLHDKLQNLVKEGKKFTQFTNEPYVTELKKHLIIQKRSSEKMLLYGDQLRYLLSKVPTRPKNFILRLAKTITLLPFQWIKLSQNVRELCINLDDYKEDLGELQKSLKHMQDLPWETSLKVQELQKLNFESGNILQSLYKSRVGGEKFKEAIEHYRWLYTEFVKIPVEFRNGNKNTIIRLNDNVTPTIISYEIVQKITPPAGAFLLKVRQWKGVYDDTVNMFARLLKTLSEIPRLFGEIPNVIDVTDEKSFSVQIARDTIALQKAQHQPTIEMLEENIKKILVVIKNTDQLTNTLINCQTNYKRLVQQFSQIDGKLTKIRQELYDQSVRGDYPIVWNATKPKLIEIENDLANLGTIDTKRTTSELEKALETLGILSSKSLSLEESCTHIEALAEELRKTNQECVKIIHAKWLSAIEQLSINTGKYSRENWEPADYVDSLYSDAANLLSLANTILPNDISASVIDWEIETLLKTSKKLLNDLESIEKRKARISVIFNNIQRQESESIGILEKLLPVVDAISPEISLDKVPLQTASNLLDLSTIGKELRDELSRPEIGMIFDKANRITRWEQEVYETTNSLISDLKTEIDYRQNQISRWIKDLTLYARQILDPAIERVQQYQYVNVYSFDIVSLEKSEFKQASKQITDLVQKYLQVKYCSDEFESAVLQPLAESYTDVEALKDAAEKQLADAERIFRRTWPPVHESLDLQENKLKLEHADEFLKDIRRQKQTVHNILNDFTDLKMRYRDIFGDIQSKIARDKDSQGKFQAIEEDAYRRLHEMGRRYFGTNSDDDSNYRLRIFLEQGGTLLESIKIKYERKQYNSYDVEIAMRELFRTHTTYIDRSQNIQIRNITLSDGSEFNINQSN